MSFLKSLKNLFSGGGRSGGSDRQTFVLYVMDHRCREPMRGEVNLLSELSKGDDGSEFYVRKVLHTSGNKRCFGQVEVQLWFDSRKTLLRHQVSGGKWLSAEEYTAALERFNAPPEEETDTNEAGEGIERG